MRKKAVVSGPFATKGEGSRADVERHKHDAHLSVLLADHPAAKPLRILLARQQKRAQEAIDFFTQLLALAGGPSNGRH